MIQIKRIWIEKKQGKARLAADIIVPPKAMDAWIFKCPDSGMKSRYHRDFADKSGNFTLWYEVDESNADSLCPERADAFVVACLYYAMITGEDIHCDVPVTDKLLYQLREYIIPSLCRPVDGQRRIQILANPEPRVESIVKNVGTGVSCGVDSFSSIIVNMKDSVPQPFQLTYLTLFNTGSLNFAGYSDQKSLLEWNKETNKEFGERASHGEKVAAELGLNFISVNTNIPDLYQGCFFYSHTFRNCSAVLATQKMWKTYYYASAGEPIQVNAGLTRSNADYDLLALSGISLDNLTFYSSCLPYQRMEKIALIADNPVVQKYLNVCSFETKNCGRCEKCLRTITALDLMGKLGKFTNSFADLTYYKKNKWKLQAVIMEATPDKPFLFDQRQYMGRNNIHLQGKSLCYHYLLPLRKIWIKLHELGRR